MFPFPISQGVWGYQLMGDPDDPEVEVMLAAIKSNELAEIDDVCRQVRTEDDRGGDRTDGIVQRVSLQLFRGRRCQLC